MNIVKAHMVPSHTLSNDKTTTLLPFDLDNDLYVIAQSHSMLPLTGAFAIILPCGCCFISSEYDDIYETLLSSSVDCNPFLAFCSNGCMSFKSNQPC